jgi:uroporphyrinogen decarboxylase
MTLLAPWNELQYHIDRLLEEADGRQGHIFNLGHGLHKTTPVDNVRRLVDYVHKKTGGKTG